MTKGLAVSVGELQALVAQAGSARQLIAIAGAPGSGKSTFTGQFVAALNTAKPGAAVVLPMDGYHFDDRVLVERGLRPRKGAPETFDVAGLQHMLQRLRDDLEDDVAVPVFDRDIEIARAAAQVISRSARTIIIEGNYLLLHRQPWSGLHNLFDATVMIDVDEEILRQRLIARWEGYGFADDEVRRKVEANDLPNGHLVIRDSVPADYILRG